MKKFERVMLVAVVVLLLILCALNARPQKVWGESDDDFVATHFEVDGRDFLMFASGEVIEVEGYEGIE